MMRLLVNRVGGLSKREGDIFIAEAVAVAVDPKCRRLLGCGIEVA